LIPGKEVELNCRNFASVVRVLAICCAFGADTWADSWEDLRRNGDLAREQGRYREARQYLETALAELDQETGLETPDLLHAALDHELAGVCNSLGDSARAEFLLVEAQNIIETHPEANAGLRSSVLGGMGMFRASQGRLKEAKELMERGLASRQSLGERDTGTATMKSGLGQIYMLSGNLADAERLLQSAVEVHRARLPARNLDRIVSETSLGTVYVLEGRYQAAEVVLQQVSEEARQMGESHPAYAATLTVLADLHRLKGDVARREPLLRKAQAIYEESLGPQSMRVAETLLDMSIDLAANNKFTLAEADISRALNIFRKARGEEDPMLALGEYQLAKVYLQQRKYAEAEALLKHALSIQEKTWPDGHYAIGDTLYQLAEAQRLQRRYADAELQYKAAIAVYEKSSPSQSRGLAVALQQYARLLRTRRTDEARILEKRAQDLKRTIQAFR
jgi:tetratricopeptide (TPR) repeat protein